MKRKFKSKKSKTNKIKLVLYLLIIITSFIFTLKLFLKENIKDIFLNLGIEEVFKNKSYFISNIFNNAFSPKDILYNSLNKTVDKSALAVFSNVEDDYKYENNNTNFVDDPDPKEIKDPLVYIYNSHQLEEYNMKGSFDYSLKPNVMIASFILREELEKKGIKAIVETNNIKKYLSDNSLSYKNSYKASRHFIQKTINNNNSIKYMIDIHRDSSNINKTLTTLNNKEYARMMFVVGMEHENASYNLSFATSLNNKINEMYPSLSRGIIKKQGKEVNGIYNQDLLKNAILIELGGVDNTIEQVNNTVASIADILSIYIREGLR
ncbi:MAG: stage II sporulation protein P [Bacilli bacterium]